jgi:hypothetical protein
VLQVQSTAPLLAIPFGNTHNAVPHLLGVQTASGFAYSINKRSAETLV